MLEKGHCQSTKEQYNGTSTFSNSPIASVTFYNLCGDCIMLVFGFCTHHNRLLAMAKSDISVYLYKPYYLYYPFYPKGIYTP